MTRTILRVALGALVLLHSKPVAALAQGDPRIITERLRPGEPVRAVAPSVRKNPCKGRFEAVRSDTLVIRAYGRPCTLALFTVVRVDRRVDRESGGEALFRGGVTGAAAGAGIIYLLGVVTGELFHEYSLTHAIAGMAAMPGALIGTLIGVANPKEKWENVWRIDRPDPAQAPTGDPRASGDPDV